MLGRYRRELEADFARRFPQHALGDLWRQRRWRYLLNLIDHLPQDTYYHQAVSKDPEHAKMLARARAQMGDDDKAYAPPMSSWSAELDMSAKILDAVNNVSYTLAAVNYQGKGPKPERPKPHPRPDTAFEKGARQAKAEAHKRLVARMLPHKNKGAEPGA